MTTLTQTEEGAS